MQNVTVCAPCGGTLPPPGSPGRQTRRTGPRQWSTARRCRQRRKEPAAEHSIRHGIFMVACCARALFTYVEGRSDLADSHGHSQLSVSPQELSSTRMLRLTQKMVWCVLAGSSAPRPATQSASRAAMQESTLVMRSIERRADRRLPPCFDSSCLRHEIHANGRVPKLESILAFDEHTENIRETFILPNWRAARSSCSLSICETPLTFTSTYLIPTQHHGVSQAHHTRSTQIVAARRWSADILH